MLLTAVTSAVATAGEKSCPIDAESVGDDLVALAESPAHWSGAEWAAAGAVAGLTTALVAGWDEDIRRASIEAPHTFPYSVVRRISWLGRWYGKSDLAPVITFAAVAGGIFAAGKANDDDRLVRTSGILTESYLVTGGLVVLVKLVSGRARPYTGEGARRWRFAGLHGRDWRSFPSGHASSAVSMATVLSKRHDHWYVSIPAWTLAAGFSAQRIDSGVHWTSDVLVGAVIGYAVSAFLTARHTCEGPDADETTPFYASIGFNF